jgi:hypothetical protein
MTRQSERAPRRTEDRRKTAMWEETMRTVRSARASVWMRCAAVAAGVLGLAGCGSGAGGSDEELGVTEQHFTIPDSWTCATKVWETGASRTLGNDSYRVDVGVQSQGALKLFHPVDVAFDAIATVKGTSISYNWKSTVPVRAVITSAGPGTTTVFDYRPGATSGMGIAANNNVTSLEPVYMLFCFDAPPPICGG